MIYSSDHSLYVGQRSQRFTQQRSETGTLISPIVQMRKLSQGEVRSPAPGGQGRIWGLEPCATGTQTKQTTTHTSRARPRPSGGSHPSPQHAELQTHRKHDLPPCARTSPPAVSTCAASLPREAGRELRSSDAVPRRCAAATRAPLPCAPAPPPPPSGGEGVQDPPPAGTQRERAAHAASDAQPAP